MARRRKADHAYSSSCLHIRSRPAFSRRCTRASSRLFAYVSAKSTTWTCSREFQSVTSRRTYINYLDIVANRAQAAPYVERLLATEALISPVWHDGVPAILKGFLRLRLLAGRHFKIEKGQYSPMPFNIKPVGAVLLLWRQALAHDRHGRSATSLCKEQFRRSDATTALALSRESDAGLQHVMSGAGAAARICRRSRIPSRILMRHENGRGH
jgi:hypothetical protein